jgi:spore maturation protein CgeB
MKIAIVGSSGSDSLEANMLEAFALIPEVEPFLIQWPPNVKMSGLGIIGRAINKISRFPLVVRVMTPIFLVKIQFSKPDLILVCTGAARTLSPNSVSKLKQHSRAVFCWFVDASMNVNDYILYSKYDHTYFVDQGLHQYLRPLLSSTSSSVLLEGYNELHHRPLSEIKKSNKIAVVGSLYPERILLLEYLVSHGFEFEIYGFGLPRGYGNGPLHRFDMKKFLTLEEKSKVFQMSKCVLNSFTPAHLNAINCRVFEAMASGALVVSQTSNLLKSTFQDGRDLILFDSFEELVEILKKIFDGKYDEESIRVNAISAVSPHSLTERARTFISDFNDLATNK